MSRTRGSERNSARYRRTAPGVGSSGSIAIPEGQNEAVIPLTANSGAEINKWRIVVLGDATVGDGPVTVASQMATLEVAEPFVSFEFLAATTEKGKPTDVVVKVTKAKDFEGEAEVTLRNAGVNILAVSHAIPLEGNAAADKKGLTATLTFVAEPHVHE